MYEDESYDVPSKKTKQAAFKIAKLLPKILPRPTIDLDQSSAIDFDWWWGTSWNKDNCTMVTLSVYEDIIYCSVLIKFEGAETRFSGREDWDGRKLPTLAQKSIKELLDNFHLVEFQHEKSS